MLLLNLLCFDCGKPIYKPEATKKHGFGGTGYAIDDDKNKICYQCCAVRDKKQMLSDGEIFLYLDKEKKIVTNWPGTLIIPVNQIKYSYHNMAGKNGRRDFWFMFDWQDWHGFNVGDSQIARCHKLKNNKGSA